VPKPSPLDRLATGVSKIVATKLVVDAARDLVEGVKYHGGVKHIDRAGREFLKLKEALDDLDKAGE
jgi:hypothetical protein